MCSPFMGTLIQEEMYDKRRTQFFKIIYCYPLCLAKATVRCRCSRCFCEGDPVSSLSNRPCVVFAAVPGVFVKVTLCRLYQTDRVLCLPLFQMFL